MLLSQDKAAEDGRRLIDMLESMFAWLLHSADPSAPGSAEALTADEDGPDNDESSPEVPALIQSSPTFCVMALLILHQS